MSCEILYTFFSRIVNVGIMIYASADDRLLIISTNRYILFDITIYYMVFFIIILLF